MEHHIIDHNDLESAIEALKEDLSRYPEPLKESLHLYLCSFTLLLQAFKERPWEPLDVTTGQISTWAAEFFSQYKTNSSFDETYEDFVLWIKTKQSQYVDNLN